MSRPIHVARFKWRVEWKKKRSPTNFARRRLISIWHRKGGSCPAHKANIPLGRGLLLLRSMAFRIRSTEFSLYSYLVTVFGNESHKIPEAGISARRDWAKHMVLWTALRKFHLKGTWSVWKTRCNMLVTLAILYCHYANDGWLNRGRPEFHGGTNDHWLRLSWPTSVILYFILWCTAGKATCASSLL